MNATIILAVGLEYMDSVFQTIQDSEFSRYTIVGIKSLAVLLFLVNILKKYNEGLRTGTDIPGAYPRESWLRILP